MASKSNIEWTDATWDDPIVVLLEPLKRKKPTTYSVNSMGDLFHEDCPDEWIDKAFAVMALAPQHTFQVLMKRAERMREYCSRVLSTDPAAMAPGAPHAAQWRSWIQMPKLDARTNGCSPPSWPLPNVWLGVSVERQQEADERIPHLLQTPAAIRFVSVEPLLGPIDLWRHCVGFPPRLDWVIVGGESGSKARPMHPDWARSIRDQCAAAGVAYFFKQWGRYAPQHDDPMEPFFASLKEGSADHEVDKGFCFGRSANQRPWMMFDLGKKAAGRLLDGIEHNAMPSLPSALAGTQTNNSDQLPLAHGKTRSEIVYDFPVTDEFRAWIDKDGKPFSQAEFAAFIEEHAAELASPLDAEKSEYTRLFKVEFATPTVMVSLSRGLQVNVEATVKQNVTLSSGEGEIEFSETHLDKRGEKLTVPGLFMVSVAAFMDGGNIRLPARLRYRVNGGKVTWFYQLYRWKFWLRDRVQQDLKEVVEETKVRAFEGSPEA